MMAVSEAEKLSLNAFKEMVSPEQYAPKDIWVSYIGSIFDSEKQVYSARIFIRNFMRAWDEFSVETDRLFAGRFSLSETGVSLDELIDECCDGKLCLPFGRVRFPGRGPDDLIPNVYLDLAHASVTQERVTVLRFGGRQTHNPRFDKSLDWELRAASRPYNSYSDLANELSLSGAYEHDPMIEFVAYQSTFINRAKTNINGGFATITVSLAKGLNPDKFSLGISQNNSGKTSRYMVASSDFCWTELDDFLEGRIELQVQKSDVLQCFANYNGVNYSDFWIADPAYSKNPRNAALSLFDPRLDQLTKWLLPENDGKARSTDFEMGISRLFWMIGFSPALIDSPQGNSDIPDVIVSDSTGRLLLLECTLGRIGNKDKLEKLAERERLLKDQLMALNLGHVIVSSAIATKIPLDTISTDLKRASELGISVLGPVEVETLLKNSAADGNSVDIMNWIIAKKPGLGADSGEKVES